MDESLIDILFWILTVIGGLVSLAGTLLLVIIIWSLVLHLWWKRKADHLDLARILNMIEWVEKNGPPEYRIQQDKIEG